MPAARRSIADEASPSARRALQHAVTLHRDGDAMGLIRCWSRARLGGARRVLAARGIEPAILSIVGNPAQTICMTAEREGYDTIVVGRRSLRDAGLLLLGSVAGRVVAGPPGDVMVVV